MTTQEELGQPKENCTWMPYPPSALQVREVETIVNFLVAKVVKRGPMDRATCIEFWDSEVEVCGEFPSKQVFERYSYRNGKKPRRRRECYRV
jgi:hypothetical protein